MCYTFFTRILREDEGDRMRETKRRDLFAIIVMILLCATSIMGILSFDHTHAYDVVNQYGHTVSLYGYGIYAHDTFFKATISTGTDVCILFVLVPLFLYTYWRYTQQKAGSRQGQVAELQLISVYAVALYYGASMAFGVVYNSFVLVYMALFACSLFGMFSHITRLGDVKTVRLTKGMTVFLVISGVALFAAWLPDIINSLLHGGVLPLIGIYTTEITYVLDMGIISPLCFLSIYLLHKQNGIGTILTTAILKLCMIVGIMMVTQSISQLVAGVDLPLVAILTKSASFVVLAAFAAYFNHKIYKELLKF